MRSRNPLQVVNSVDAFGNPAGGGVEGLGLSVQWQSEPLGNPPTAPNGAFVEELIEAARQRLGFYQTAANYMFYCQENALALTRLEEAAMWLRARRENRGARGVQGTLTP